MLLLSHDCSCSVSLPHGALEGLWSVIVAFLEEHSGRVIDSRSRSCELEPLRRHCVVSLSKTLYPLLSTGLTQRDPSRHDRKYPRLGRMEPNQTNK